LNFTNEQIEMGQIPSAQTVLYAGLNTNYRIVQIIRLILTLFVFGGVYTLFISLVPKLNKLPLSWVLSGLGAIFLLGIVTIFVSFRFKGYALRTRDILYKKGWLFKSTTIVPFNRVQHCEVTQGPISSFFNLTRLHVYTAGGSQSDLVIPGILKSRATELKHFITDRTTDGEEE